MIHLNIGLSALRTSQTALNTIANNIANATTEGYHRQEVIQETRPSTIDGSGNPVGSGVDINQIRRLYDVSVERALTGNTSHQAEADARLATLEDLEHLLTPATGSLHAEISDFFAMAEQLAASPSDNVLRSQFVSAADGVAREINRLADSFANLQTELQDQIERDVASVNMLAEQIAEVNAEIRIAEATGPAPNTLLDRRDQLINELSQFVDVDTQSIGDDGGLVVAAGGWLLIGTSAPELQVEFDDNGMIELQVDSTTVPVTLQSGELAGLMTAHNELVPQAAADVAEWADAFVQSVDQIHATGLGLDGPFSIVNGTRGVEDSTLPLDAAGTAFPVTAGELAITVTEESTGQRTTHRLTIDPATDSLDDVAAQIDGIAGISALVDAGTGKLTIAAGTGFRFDFAGHLDQQPETSAITGTAAPTIGGLYTGSENSRWTVTALGTGEVGFTPGLQLEVRDAATGELVETFDVGDGYEAGQPLEIADGVTLALDNGTFNSGDSFTVSALSNPDETGLLSALGMRSFFSGSAAGDLEVNAALKDDPTRLATSRSGLPGDTSILNQFVELRDERLIGNETLEGQLGDMTGRAGLAVQAVRAEIEQLSSIGGRLQAEQVAKSGVDPNEELLTMLEYQRSYQVAARFVTSVDQTLNEVLSLIG
ncbi:Flagellar hook-associated protein 1 [Maioricimonas rarisocia]|uniref:Flagellar hook-associated protein 1 n=1 Tax=Maioricimonas rarisocia TaxID=2528026 RepID=A0A517ZCQ0_9PLAN|nr:flagellar hook-associated protein FlgK [Maioricimonas rarisocia]QDU40239.1 Flagellar hook-associated protein 1 [Maioricimonas rarisocia]